MPHFKIKTSTKNFT